MSNHNDYIEKCSDPSKRHLDRNRGFQAEGFADALGRVAAGELAAKIPAKDINSELRTYLAKGIKVDSPENFG